MTQLDTQTVHSILADLTFPAQRWEILISADIYGADAITLERLRRLPAQREPYHDLGAVVEALDSIPAQAIRSTMRPPHRQGR